jgi:hypothetical protein
MRNRNKKKGRHIWHKGYQGARTYKRKQLARNKKGMTIYVSIYSS